MYTKEEVIAKAKEIHGDIYDYSKVVWKNIKEEVIVICPKHGEFKTSFDRLINGKCKCPSCRNLKRYNNEEWISEAKKRHGDKYDYSKTIYKNAQEKVTIICHEKDEFGEEHGEFHIRAGNHMAGIGCPKCGKRYKMTQDEFIKRAKNVHGDKYDYSKTKYTYSSEKVDIICPKHGVFTQNASSHLSGCGCPKCKNGVRLTNETFIERAREVHGDYYDYSKVDYKHAKLNVLIGCPRHGYFYQTPTAHIRGCGCPECKSSKLEDVVIKALKENDIKYIYQSKVLNMGLKTVDFYIPDRKIIIECQGEQHFNPVKFKSSDTDDEAKEHLSERKKIDSDKYEKSLSLGLDMLYFADTRYFNKKSTNIFGGFYRNKHLFSNIDELVTYINGARKNEFTTGNIYYELNKELGYVGIPDESGLKIKEYMIKIVTLKKENSRIAKEMRNWMVKKKYKPIILFEDELENNKKLVLDKIRHITKTETTEKGKIYGRKIEVIEISSTLAKWFLDNNHIQGYVTSTLHLGALYNNELVGVMSFLQETRDHWNLVRFATDNNKICCGVGGKLFSYFVKNKNPKTVKSFADRRWTVDSENNLYISLGFKLDGLTRPDYKYYNLNKDGYKRFHKFLFRKNILNKRYGLPLSMTENEMTQFLGYDRIWDCGLYRYVYVNPKPSGE